MERMAKDIEVGQVVNLRGLGSDHLRVDERARSPEGDVILLEKTQDEHLELTRRLVCRDPDQVFEVGTK